jgi:hypothetical protein
MYQETKSKLAQLLQWGYSYDSIVIGGELYFVLGDLQRMCYEVMQNSSNDKDLDSLRNSLPYLGSYYESAHEYMLNKAQESARKDYNLSTGVIKDYSIIYDWFGVIGSIYQNEVVEWYYNTVKGDHI